MASIGKWVSDVSRLALADVSGTGWLADGRLVARVGIANSTGHALDLGQRISPVARRTLALRFVVLGDANRIFPARLSVADIVAGVVQSVAQLVCRAVHVVDARHLFASGTGIVGISSKKSRRTLAASNVVVDHADRLRSTLNAQTSREAAKHAVNLPASLRLWTLSVR